ncbi:response regulator transcription factor [Neokomagataea anthophila]|uniref:Response regulator transcription factor n=1 Tax=Neokomagataea anthophila TaxID=2826925 RepID=A0ABS5E976_9PROT|nr:response regulator transcription factor [Neokomagataea anthophila]MBR0560454.1 response regulator transcription factor [Neokomagataea anthophila]
MIQNVGDQLAEVSSFTPHILIVEDDPDMAAFVSNECIRAGMKPVIAPDGETAEVLGMARSWDLVILDRRLPGRCGLDVLHDLRRKGIQVPILFLTTMDGIASRVEGLRAGADDYVIKPFAPAELMARINVLLRRIDRTDEAVAITVGALRLDLLTRTVSRNGMLLRLQSQEFQVLVQFMRHPGMTLSHAMLFETIWGIDFPVNANLLAAHISRLRERIGQHSGVRIVTLRGVGYRLEVEY